MAVETEFSPNSLLGLCNNRSMQFSHLGLYAPADSRGGGVSDGAACFLPLYQSLETYKQRAHRNSMIPAAACNPGSAPMIPSFQQQVALVPMLHTPAVASKPHQSKKRKTPSNDMRAPSHTLPQPTNFSVLNLLDLNHAQARPSSSPGHNIVSTGLRLASFDDDGGSTVTSSRLDAGSACIKDELTAQLLHQQNEMQQLFKTYTDQLQNAVKERAHSHSQALLASVEDVMSGRLRDKEAELGRVKRHNSELEERIKHLSLETHVWQSKARSYEAMVSVLRANLQQAMMHQSREQSKIEGWGDSDADDAASVHVDENPDAQQTRAMIRMEKTAEVLRACKRCRAKEATVLVLPCMHLCLCDGCKQDVERCPVCMTPKNAVVEVFLS